MTINDIKTEIKKQIAKLNPTGRRTERLLDSDHICAEIEKACEKAKAAAQKNNTFALVTGASCGGSVCNSYSWKANTDGILVEFFVESDGTCHTPTITTELAPANKCTALTIARHLGADQSLLCYLDDRYSKKTFKQTVGADIVVFW